jgi:serine/threonine-protein kinase RsbW
VQVPGEIIYRHLVLRALAAVCKVAIKSECGQDELADDFTHQVISAVGEAFNNIAVHCYRDRPLDIVRIAMNIQMDRLVFTLEDFGTSFDPMTAPPPDLEALPESGLGVFIMRSFMDEVRYRPGKPNQLVLSKRICGCPGGLPSIEGRREREMDFSTSHLAGVATLRIDGELDAVTIPDVRPAIDALIAERPMRIVVDLSGLRLIDSSGIGALVFLYKRVKEYGGVVTVAGVHDQPLSIFKLLRLDRVLFA